MLRPPAAHGRFEIMHAAVFCRAIVCYLFTSRAKTRPFERATLNGLRQS
jgi:hypothetical protein